MKKFLYCMFIIFFLTAISAFAAQPDQRIEKDAYQKELEKLKKENPKKYEEMRSDFVFITELVLATLGYSIEPFDGILDEKTKIALKTYQKKRNIPETGDPLSFDTIEQLQADMNTIVYHPVILPRLHVFTDLWDEGYVSASGTWVLSNDKMGKPEQTSKINCDRHSNICTEAVAIVSGKGSERILFVDIDTYEIERWDDYEIVTKPLQSTIGCVRYVRRINRLQKSVTGIRSTIQNEDMCKGVDSKEIYMVLTDGFNVYWDLLQERNKKWRQLLNISPTLLQQLESANKEKSK